MPAIAVADVVIVRFVVPVPGASVAGEKTVVTPLGCPLAASARPAGNLPWGAVHVNRTFVACPRPIDSVVALAVSEHLGTMAVTIKLTVAVLEMAPPVAVTVTVYEPATAELAVANCSELVPDPGAAIEPWLKVAVTPEGTPLALKTTGQLYPPLTATAMLTVAFCPACKLTAVGAAVREKVPFNEASCQ